MVSSPPRAEVPAVAALDRLARALARPTDVAALVAFRAMFGCLCALSAARFFFFDWIDRFFVTPTFAFKYFGFAWVPIWPPGGMRLHLAALTLLGLAVAAGALYRVTAPLLFVAFTHLQLMDASLYLNHYYLVSLLSLLLVFLPLGRAGSVDAWLWPERRLRSFPAWCTYLLRFQIGLVYVFAAFAKLSTDWLVHAQPLNIWLHARTEMPLLGRLFHRFHFALALSWVGLLYDATIVGWLSWPKSRPFAYAVVLVFHTLTHLLFNIGMFPFIMSACALVFFGPSWPRRLLPSSARVAPSPLPGHRPLRRGTLAVLLAWCLLHVAFPLRHYLYPGNVLWNEDGMRWSWKVKVHEKNGAVTYFVTLPNGRRHVVLPSRYLADYQEREMSGQPDLILQLAHHIAADYDARGYGPVEVRAEAIVALNGRPAAALIDPSVDLARVRDSLAPAHYVLPLPDAPPRRLGR